YSRRTTDGGIGNVTINGTAPTALNLTGNSNMVVFDPPNDPKIIPAVDELDFARIADASSSWDNSSPAIACHEVISGLSAVSGDKTLRITAADTDGMTIWGIAYWNGTFIWTINASQSGRSVSAQRPFMFPELIVPKVDYVISQSYGLNVFSQGITKNELTATMSTIAAKCKE